MEVGFTLGAGGLQGQLNNFSSIMGEIFPDITGGVGFTLGAGGLLQENSIISLKLWV